MSDEALKEQVVSAVSSALAGAEPVVTRLLESCGEKAFCFVPVIVVVVAGNRSA